MSPAPLRRWIVRRSHFPLALPGEKLGVVEAEDALSAGLEARKTIGGPITVEPERGDVNPQLERVVNRAVKAAGRRERAGAYGARRAATKPMKGPKEDRA